MLYSEHTGPNVAHSLRLMKPPTIGGGSPRKGISFQPFARRGAREKWGRFDLILTADFSRFLGKLEVEHCSDGSTALSFSAPKVDPFLTRMQKYAKLAAEELSACDLVRDFSPEKRLTFRDAAHYYGTLPMENVAAKQSVNSDFMLGGDKTVRFIGASGFATGGGGHPTLLASATASRLQAT